MHVRVRTLLKMSKRDFAKNWKGVFEDDNGNVLSLEQARESLFDELAKGHELIPCGICTNFDYSEKGCLGHSAEEMKEQTNDQPG